MLGGGAPAEGGGVGAGVWSFFWFGIAHALKR